MSDILRYEREPGVQAGVAEDPLGGAVVVLGETGVGDLVWPPQEVCDGTMQRITEVFREVCLIRGCGAVVKHYAVSGEDRLFVAECARDKFVWYRRSESREAGGGA